MEPATVPVIGEYIAIRPGYCGGKPHIAGHWIKVQDATIRHERMDMTPEAIVATSPTLSLPAVNSALTYYPLAPRRYRGRRALRCRAEGPGGTVAPPGEAAFS